MSQLSKYYIKLAEQVFPVIEVDGGRVVDVVLTRGQSIERR
jgi:conjugal transfer pilus assembly protein TraB